MLLLDESTIHALFRNQNGDDWIGGVHMVSKFYEYVPFTLHGKKYIVSLRFPNYLNDIGFYEDMLLKAVDGGYFIPKRDHRIISLLSIDDNYSLSPMKEIPYADINSLLKILFNAILSYNNSNSYVNQYFFESVSNLGNLLQEQIPLMIPKGNSVMFHDEISPPLYGFTIVRPI
ncbi:hypothetical protein [Xenorhabdus japonica]|uniref:Uncharacterized protein n=1 Tax=Xenorhabdus japonica TaxID=53341 RepID=A0A1I4YDV7_9GAMM|nr:hypothetical protein [Xenorhabdus japonica]SFN35769.1 hypothetical protein SAMN05421579_101169 [Xenorhabdus japonica]